MLFALERNASYIDRYIAGCLLHGALPVRSASGIAHKRLDTSRRFRRFEVLRYAKSFKTRRRRGKTVDIVDFEKYQENYDHTCTGMDRRGDADILHLRSRSGRAGGSRQLQ